MGEAFEVVLMVALGLLLALVGVAVVCLYIVAIGAAIGALLGAIGGAAVWVFHLITGALA